MGSIACLTHAHESWFSLATEAQVQHKHKSIMSSENEGDTRTSASTRKGKKCLRRGHFHGEISTLMLAHVLASLVKSRL